MVFARSLVKVKVNINPPATKEKHKTNKKDTQKAVLYANTLCLSALHSAFLLDSENLSTLLFLTRQSECLFVF